MMDEMIGAALIGAGITIVEMVFLVIIFRKAGFNWLFAMLSLGPLLGLALQVGLLFPGIVTPVEGMSLGSLLAVLPFAFLAFKSWPISALPDTSPETFK